MPTIPTINGNQVQQSPLPTVRVDRQVRTGLASVGQGLENAGNVISQIQAEERKKAIAAQTIEADTVLSQWATSAVDEASALQGKNAFDVGSKILPKFDEETTRIENGLTDKRAKLIFRQAANQTRVRVGSQLNRHEADQRDRYYNEVEANGVSALIGSATPETLADDLDKQSAILESRANRLGQSPEEKAASIKEARDKTYLGVITRQLASGNAAQASELLESQKAEIPAQQYATLRKTIDAKQVEDVANGLLAEYTDKGPESASASLLAMRDSIPPDQYRDVLSTFNAGISGIRAQKQIEYADTLQSIQSDLGADAVTNGTQLKVDNLWKVGALSPSEYATLTGQIQAGFRQQAAAAQPINEVMSALQDGLPLDPTDAKQMQALDAAFKRDTTQLALGSDGWKQLALSYAARTTVLPKMATQWADRALRSTDPALVASAAEFVSGVQNATPTQTFDKYTKARADLINGQTKAGVSAERAVTQADTIMRIDDSIREKREAEYRKATGPTGADPAGALNSFISGDSDFNTGRNPSADFLMQSDFDTLSRDYYSLTQDLKKSQELAYKDLKRNYGISTVNGEKEVTLLPVEKFGVPPDVVRAELADFLKANPQPDGSTADELYIVADSQTMKNSRNLYDGTPINPSWKIITRSGAQAVTANGVPQRFYLPNPDERAAINERKRAAALDAAQGINRVNQAQSAELRRLMEGE